LSHSTPAPEPPIAVPHTDLSADALQGVIESFVLREGTDYGERDISLQDKADQVLHQLERGEARIIFDPASGTIDIVVVALRERRGRRP
jgi:uncharacterized protein YheU (UPF0270 family)